MEELLLLPFCYIIPVETEFVAGTFASLLNMHPKQKGGYRAA